MKVTDAAFQSATWTPVWPNVSKNNKSVQILRTRPGPGPGQSSEFLAAAAAAAKALSSSDAFAAACSVARFSAACKNARPNGEPDRTNWNPRAPPPQALGPPTPQERGGGPVVVGPCGFLQGYQLLPHPHPTPGCVRRGWRLANTTNCRHASEDARTFRPATFLNRSPNAIVGAKGPDFGTTCAFAAFVCANISYLVIIRLP